jgi:hypothetical protein
MKSFGPVSLAVILFAFGSSQAQPARGTDPLVRPRTVAAPNPQTPATQPLQTPKTQTQSSQRASEPAAQTNQTPSQVANESNSSAADNESGVARRLSPVRLRMRINEAERLMKSRPLPTALTAPSLNYVTLAALLPETSQIHLIRVAKETFLTKGAEFPSLTSHGLPVQIRILRANGVNTAVMIFDDRNRSLIPLVVEFPIEKRGVFREMAYYTSAHPALLSPELMKTGQFYVSTMVDLAAKRLRERGVPIAQNIIEVAKRLCVVEHVDHDRFRDENRIALFEEIYSLYALNELDTYRYSVSSAGAGGMVQMIPWTYALMRQRYPAVGLNPDFVAGMRNHGNALEAMLLYMRETWSDLTANEDIQSAIIAREATAVDLMAAAYNSNAAKLPGYIRRGGAGWRALIPRETQIYLQIYQTLDALMPAKKHE